MRHARERRTVVDAARWLNESGLSVGTSGNVSVCVDEGFLVTPSGVPYEELRPRDVVLVALDGEILAGELAPSSEWRIHRDLYAHRSDAQAVVHAHPMFATTLAILRKDLPAVHYMIAVAGGSTVRCAPYATFGTPELSEHVLAALTDRKACLLANHGLVALGGSMEEAKKVAREVENVAAQYWRALQVGEPVVLDDEEMARIVEAFRTYGQRPGR